MFGTVMMSNPTPNSQHVIETIPSTANGNNNINNAQQKGTIETISNKIAKSMNSGEYVSDCDQMSERGGYKSINQQHYSSNPRPNKTSHYQLDGNSLAFDQQPMTAPTIPKVNEQSLKALTMSVNENSTKYSKSSSNNNDSTANKLRNQQSHQYQHHSSARQASDRSVNFNNDTKNGSDENAYSKIRTEKNHNRSHKSRESKQHRHETNRDSKKNNLKHPADDEETDASKIQVQILPQDENWGENTTAFTADFSDFNDDMTEDGRESHFDFKGGRMRDNPHNFDADNIDMQAKQNIRCISRLKFYCSSYFGFICSMIIGFGAFITPILFIILPRLNIWEVEQCGLECEGLLVGIAFKLFILLIGVWALFVRRPRAAQLPRVYELRTLLIILLCLMTFSYWLFYAVRIIDTRLTDYHEILQFTVSYVDVLLFIFIVSVFVLHLRQHQPEFVVKIVRSPDGEQFEYNLGKMSIQRAAIWLLEQYYKDFPVYNPWLENTHKKRNAQLLKIEQAANSKKSRRGKGGGGDNDDDARSIKSRMDTASMVGGNFSANDRFYEEYEYERRLRKRRARLLTTTEEAFTHVRRVQNEMPDENGMVPAVMDPFETAQAVFTSIARDLRRYLRVTRQQPYFTRESIVAHLANCISYDMSPKSFLQRYLKAESLIFSERALVSASTAQNRTLNGIGSHGVNYHLNLKTMDQSWILICDTPLYQNCEDNLMFVLKQNEVSLMCSFKRMPQFNLIEDILDPQRNKFVIKFNSETTV